MTKTEEQFLSLLRAGLWGKAVDERLFQDGVDWPAILSLAREQTVVGVLSDGIGSLPLSMRPPTSMVRDLQKELIRIRHGHTVLNHVLKEVYGELSYAGIRPVLLKGQGVAQNYLYPEQRQCGDIDLYVGVRYYDLACKILSGCGGIENVTIDKHPSHRQFCYGGVNVEIHRKACCLTIPRIDKRLQAISDIYLREEACSSEKLQGTDIILPPVNFDALFLFLHFVRHFIQEGVGLRQVCDWTLYLHAHVGDIDRERLLCEVDLLGMRRFWEIFGCIAVYYLGLPPEEFPGFFKERKKLSQYLLSLIFKSGNFGQCTYFRSQSFRPKGYYLGKLHGMKQRFRCWLSVFPLNPSLLIRWVIYSFLYSLKVALLHR